MTLEEVLKEFDDFCNDENKSGDYDTEVIATLYLSNVVMQLNKILSELLKEIKGKKK